MNNNVKHELNILIEKKNKIENMIAKTKNGFDNTEHISKLKKELLDIETSILSIQQSSRNIVTSNDTISIVKQGNGLSGLYFICLNSTNEEIGMIGYNPTSNSSIYDDIFIFIYNQYDNNNYNLQALMLMAKYLKNNGVETIKLSINKEQHNQKQLIK